MIMHTLSFCLATVLSRVIECALIEKIREESRHLRRYARARTAVKEVVEMPTSRPTACCIHWNKTKGN